MSFFQKEVFTIGCLKSDYQIYRIWYHILIENNRERKTNWELLLYENICMYDKYKSTLYSNAIIFCNFV